MINEELLKLSEDKQRLESELEQAKKDAEQLQIDFTNRLATMKIDYETKEIEYKKKIRELTMQLENRSSYERQVEKNKGKKTINQVYQEALNDGSKV